MQPNLLSIRKKSLLSGISSEYKNLAKFAEDNDFHLIGEELEDSLKNSKGRLIVCRQPILMKTTRILQLSKNSMKFQKNGRPTKRPIAGHKCTQQYNSTGTWAKLKKQSSRRSQYKNQHK